MKKFYLYVLTIVIIISACTGNTTDTANVSLSKIPSDEGLFPFVISFGGADNATDISGIIEAPAGKDGFIRVEGEHFVNDKGRIRFNATNLTASANFPTHEQAERLAARLARFGINCVRLHYMDADYGPAGFGLSKERCIFARDGSDRNLDPENIDRLDYMISQFKNKGIYVNVNLYVARYEYYFKGKNAVNPSIQAKEREYAKDLLTHKNPYTGLSLAEDPCVAMIELNNEDALFTQYFGEGIKLPEWPTPNELHKCTDEKKKIEFMKMLEEKESTHWNNMRTYLVKELGVKVPITSTQLTYSSPWTFKDMDYYDNHAYWCHPHVHAQWNIRNIAMVNEPNGGELSTLSSWRLAGKPYTISEYNHPYPNFYGAEGQPMLHAYAAFQDWDGVFAYSWNNRVNEEPNYMEYYFSYAGRTDCIAHFIACAAMFLRGDVQTSPTRITAALPRNTFESEWAKEPSRNGNIPSLVTKVTDGHFTKTHNLVHRIAVELDGEKTSVAEEQLGLSKITDTKEIEWNNEDPKNGMFIVRAKNVKLFSGFPKGRTVDLGDGINLSVGQTKLGWTTISMTSKNANGFGNGSTVLLVATGYTHNKDAKFTDETNPENPDAPIISAIGKDWGTSPIMTEGIPAKITLPSKASETKCWALDESGARCKEVAVTAAEDGTSVIEIGPKYQTVWYELSVK